MFGFTKVRVRLWKVTPMTRRMAPVITRRRSRKQDFSEKSMFSSLEKEGNEFGAVIARTRKPMCDSERRRLLSIKL